MHFLEGFPMQDSIYFTLITLTSIGYGDYMPATDAGKVAVVFFVFYSMASIGNAVGEYDTPPCPAPIVPLQASSLD